MKVHCSLSQLWLSFPKAALVCRVSWESKSFVSTLPLEHVAPCPWRENKGHGEITDPLWWYGPEVAHTSLPLINQNMVPTWLQEQLGMQSRERKGGLMSTESNLCNEVFLWRTQTVFHQGSVDKGSRVEQREFSLFCGEMMPLWWLQGMGMFMVLRLQHCITSVRKASSSRVTSYDQGPLSRVSGCGEEDQQRENFTEEHETCV